MSRARRPASRSVARAWALALALAGWLAIGAACQRVATPTPLSAFPSPSITQESSGDAPTPSFLPSPPAREATATSVATRLPATAQPAPGARPSPSPGAPPKAQDAPAIVARLPLTAPLEPARELSGLARLGEQIYVASRADDRVALVVDGRVVQTLPVGRAPAAVVANEALRRVYVANERDRTLSVIEGERVSATWPLDGEPAAMALVGKELWIGPGFGQAIAILSAETGAALGEAPLPQAELISEMAVAPDATLVYASSYSTLYVVNVATRRVEDVLDLPGLSALALSPNGQELYLVGYDTGAGTSLLRVLDARTLQLSARVPVPSDSVRIVISPDGGRVYLLSDLPNRVTMLDSRNLAVLGSRTVGYGPRHALLDAAGERLYVASHRADSVAILDAETLEPLATLPLAVQVNALAVDPLTDRLYVASGSSDEVWAYDGNQRVAAWAAGPFPGELAVLPRQGQVVVMSRAAGELMLFDLRGDLLARAEVGAGSAGLLVDELAESLYAGGTLLDLSLERVRTVSVQSGMGTLEAPTKVILDTRRGRAYGVVFNGIPGSNGGYVVRPLDGEDWPTWGRLSVVDALYDEELDRFYTIWVRMDTGGLQVDQAEDGQRLYDLRLSGRPVLLGLNPATHHLWLALAERGGSPDEPTARLSVYDTRSLSVVAELDLSAPADALAIDPRNGLVYVASNTSGELIVVADVTLPAPMGAQALPTVTPYPTVTSRATAAPPAPTVACDLGVDQAFESAWAQVGGATALGCPYGEAQETAWAAQAFEGGWMSWRGAGEGTIYALLDDGTLLTFGDAWREGMPELSCEVTPPADRLQPVRGFGLLWCREPRLRQALGWALAPET
ncbi:MAG: hypothetical protein JXA74_08120, partial [Anaerolineae bacterium]|nr:hypothetical protein [Anaerolineae bacterium]